MSAPPSTCRSCSAPVAPGARFCSSCGAVQTGGVGSTGEHRGAPRSVSGEWSELQPSGDSLLDELRLATRGSYEVSHCLGRGGMAAVYLARDARLKRRVAIKVMLPELRAIPTMPERFRAEAQTAAALSHPNIIVIHSVEQVGELLFFVMSYVDGLPLDEIMRETGPLSIPLAQSLLSQVASALEYAHGEGVIHRDIKPANIMVNAKGDAVVTDFGIAKVTSSTHLTQTGATIGTAAYMSPEQCMGRDITVSSDQYSLGIVAYAMVTGRLPFDGSPFEVQMKQVQEPAPDPRRLRPDLPDPIAVSILRMMAKLPKDRYATLEEAAVAFGAEVGRSDPGARARLAELARAGSLRRSGVQPVTPPGVVPRVDAPLVLALTAERTTLEVGETLPLAVQASDSRLIAMTETNWSSSDPRVLDLTPDGRVVAVGSGTAIVTATYQAATATIQLTIVPAKVRTIAVRPERLMLRAGERASLEATPLDARGHPLRDRRVSWRSTSAVIASVAWTGEVQAISEGRAQLVASAEGVEQVIDATVTPAAVVTIRVEPARLSFVVGERTLLVAKAARSDGLPLSGRRVRWSSSDRKVVTVDDGGEATARQAGVATVTAECEGCLTMVAVEVTSAPVMVPPTPPTSRVEERPYSATAAVAAAVSDVDSAPSDAAARDGTAPRAQLSSNVPGVHPLPISTPPIVPFERETTREEGARSPVVLVAVAGILLAVSIGGWLALRPTTRSAVDSASVPVATSTEATGDSAAPAESTRVADESDAAVGDIAARDEDALIAPPAVSRVRVERIPSTLDSGSTAQLTAIALDGAGRRVNSAPVSWRTSTPQVVSVTQVGTVRALAPGRARLEAKAGNQTMAVELRVVSVAASTPSVVSDKGTPPGGQPKGSEANVEGAATGTTKAAEPPPQPPPQPLPQPPQPVPNDARSASTPPGGTTGPSEATLRQLVDEFAALVAARRSGTIDGMLAAASATNTRKDFLQFVSRAPSIGASALRASASGASARFALQVTYKTVGGQSKERQVPFSASLTSAGGSWRLAEVRLEEPCCK